MTTTAPLDVTVRRVGVEDAALSTLAEVSILLEINNLYSSVINMLNNLLTCKGMSYKTFIV